jgi:hypothetical protein
MLSIRGTYDGKQLRLSDKVNINSPKRVIVTFLDEENDELSSDEMLLIVAQGGAFDFLSEEEDTYSDKDMKVVYK